MSVLPNRPIAGHLDEAVVHFNRAVEQLAVDESMVEIARTLFDGLNKVQSDWRHQPQGPRVREVEAFKSMILGKLGSEAREIFLGSPEFKCFAEFEPQIMNHKTLNSGGYNPGAPVSGDLLAQATKEHRSLCESFASFLAAGGDNLKENVIEGSARLLYVVRSNIAHGEKTPYGPDLDKTARDQRVSAVVVPLLQLLFDLLFERPSQRLVVYGTLAPGEVNHRMIENIHGCWQDCKLHGLIDRSSGLPKLLWIPSGGELRAKLLESAELANHWERLDRFEGSRYKRQLVPVRTEGGIVIASVYAGA